LAAYLGEEQSSAGAETCELRSSPVARAGEKGAPRSRAKAALADDRSAAARGRGFAHVRPRVTQVIGENRRWRRRCAA